MTEQYPQGIWDASEYFEQLTATNRLAKSEHFTFCHVSGLDGFEEALAHMQRTTAFVCVSDIANGFTELNNTPHRYARSASAASSRLMDSKCSFNINL